MNCSRIERLGMKDCRGGYIASLQIQSKWMLFGFNWYWHYSG